MEKMLQELLTNFKSEFLTEVRQIVKEEVKDIREDVAKLKEDVSRIHVELVDLKHEVGGLKQEVNGLKEDVNNLKEDVSGIKVELGDLKDEVGSLKQDVTMIKATMATKDDIASVHKKLDNIYAQVAHNSEQEVKLNETIMRVDQLETDVKLIKKAIANQ